MMTPGDVAEETEGNWDHVVAHAAAKGAVRATARNAAMALIKDGIRVDRPILPTLFDRADPDGELMREEVFGPVLTVAPFTDEADALAMPDSLRFLSPRGGGIDSLVC